MRMLSEGAESKVFETSIFGRSAVVKVRQPKAYRIRELDEALRRTRTRKEAKAMHKANIAGVRTPEIFAIGKFSIYMEKVPGKLLKDANDEGIDYGAIGMMLARMHNADVTHGDFTPANIVVGEEGICIIDFGLSDVSNSIEDKAIDLLLMKRSISGENYHIMESAYRKESKNPEQIVLRLAEIEKRGRYQIRTLA
jgi:Kae1-associated kinase Bud32